MKTASCEVASLSLGKVVAALAGVVVAGSALAAEAADWSVYQGLAEAAPELVGRVGPGANDISMRTLQFREVEPGSEMDVFQAVRDFHANRLEWTYIDFDERNNECVDRIQEMGVVFGGAGSASMHGSIVGFPPQPREMHMLNLDGDPVIQPHMRAWDEFRGIADLSNPDYYDHHLAYWKKVIDAGATTLQRDEPEGSVFAAERYGGGFSPSGVAGFQKWLGENVDEATLAELGVEDPATFDYAGYLRAREAPVGDAFRTFDDPLKPYWIRYWTDVTTGFFTRLREDLRAYTSDDPVTISCNNSSLQMWEPYHRTFDFAISELLLETAHPVHLWERTRIAREAGKVQVIGPPKTRSQSVSEEAKLALSRRVFSTAFACGMLGKVPWDVFDQSPDGESRYFVDAADFADLCAFVRAGDWAGYSEVAVAGPGLPEPTEFSPKIEGGSGGVYAFVRANPDAARPVMIQLVDWGLPEAAPEEGSLFTTASGLRIRMRPPPETLVRTGPEPFELVLPSDAFANPDALLFRLVTPAAHDADAHAAAVARGDYSEMSVVTKLEPRIDAGGIRLQIPALTPWGIVEILPAKNVSSIQEIRTDAISAAFLPADRWVSLGDSITHTGFYTRNVETFLVTRFPGKKVQLFNAGIGGDTTTGALTRLDWDVFSEEPTVVSIMFGMNDIDRRLYQDAAAADADNPDRTARITQYETNLRQLVDRIREAGARVILITPSPTDDTMVIEPAVVSEANIGLAKCAAIVREIGREQGLPVVDFHGPMIELNLEPQKDDPASTLIGRDRVHPGSVGHFVMMYLFLRDVYGSSIVSTVEIDAAASDASEVENAVITNLHATPDAVAFTLEANALPYPVPDEAVSALELVPFTSEFNSELLKVTGLTPGEYALRIDETLVGTFSADELVAGINLAAGLQTPQMEQAREVAEILIQKRAITVELGNLAFCELRLWTPRQRPVDMAEMAGLLEQAIAKENSLKEARESVLNRYKSCPSKKPRESEMREQCAALANEAAKTAQPKPRSYEIQRVLAEKESSTEAQKT